ncbi:MAG TPA: trimethylamine methyltransferase family protein [Anaerolineae bacterium]
MSAGFRSQVTPSYRLLTEEQLQELHRVTLEVLATTGVRVADDEAIAMLQAAGCPSLGDHIVGIPASLVEDAIKSAPSSITIYNRDGKEAMRLEGRNNYFGGGTDLIHTYDLHTGKLRPSQLQDVINAARVADYCSEVDFIASMGLPHDVPTNTMYVECVRAMLENSTKPIFTTAGGAEDLAYIIELAETVAGGPQALAEKPRLIHYSEPTPPLLHSYGATRKVFLCADKNVPIVYVPGGILGGTSPVTLAGALVQQNAEMLSGLVLHQLRRKGAPIICGWASVAMDMRTSVFAYGSPEFRLTHSAYADVCHYYGLPMWGTVGSDAMVLDAQAGMEHALCTLLAALDGTNLIHDIGYLGQGLVSHPGAIVMSNEIISYVRRFMRGFEMSPQTFALDVMAHVGPGGNYLQEVHTFKNFKKELWRPQLINRENPDGWQQQGSKSYSDQAIQKAIEILNTHKPAALAPEVQQQLAAIVARAQSDLAGKFFKA